MFIGGIVSIDHTRLGRTQHGDQIVAQCSLLSALHGGTRVVKLDHGSVLANLRSKVLLLSSDGPYLLIAISGIGSDSCAASAICACHAAEPFRILLIASEDAMEGHEFEVVLMRSNAKMGNSGKCFGSNFSVRNEKLGGGLVKCHVGISGIGFGKTHCSDGLAYGATFFHLAGAIRSGQPDQGIHVRSPRWPF